MTDTSRNATNYEEATFKLLDAITAMVEKTNGQMVNLPGWDELSLAFHAHPAAHVDKDKRQPRSATATPVGWMVGDDSPRHVYSTREEASCHGQCWRSASMLLAGSAP